MTPASKENSPMGLLDIRTMMVMTALLTLLLSGLLLLASLHAGNIRGIRHWALAELGIAFGLGLAYTQLHPPGNPWVIVLGATLIITGMNLQLLGIQAFRGWRVDGRMMAFSVAVVFAGSVWFSVLHHDVANRAIINSLIMGLVNAASARALLRRVEPPLRAAFRFTAATFALVSLLSFVRAIYLAFFLDADYGLYSPIPINPVSFFFSSVFQLLLTFGFMLMMHSRIAAELQRLAARDSLTGVMNRRSLEDQFEHLRALYARNGGVISVLMIDIDCFKQVNDEHGHLAGDTVLRALAELGASLIRKQDYFARYGGEEFCILLPDTMEKEAAQLAERLRQAVKGCPIELDGASYTATVSVGLADSMTVGLDFSALVAAADQALYRAKDAGRNRVVAFSSL